jgi:hypothetical protein
MPTSALMRSYISTLTSGGSMMKQTAMVASLR